MRAVSGAGRRGPRKRTARSGAGAPATNHETDLVRDVEGDASSCARIRASSASSSSRRSLQLAILGTRRRRTCATCRSSSSTAIAARQPGSDQPVHRLGHLRARRRRLGRAGRRSISRVRRSMDGAVDSGGLRQERRGRQADDAAGRCRRIGCELDEHRAGVCEQSRSPDTRRRWWSGGVPPGPPAGGGSIEPRVRVWFNPDAREPLFHAAGDLCAAAAGRHVEPVVDGHRARARGRHAGAAERHAARQARADHRQAAAVRHHRIDRRADRPGRDRVLVPGARCAAASGCCSA